LQTTGTTVVFQIVVDDYAEIWVDGRLPRVLGQRGGALVAGFNAPNRVVLTRDARPGQSFDIAVFAANGPLSDPPGNFIWIRSAALEFFKPAPPQVTRAEVVRVNPGIDDVVSSDLQVEKLAEGFQFLEGPVWSPDGYLLFSDPNANRIYRYSADDGVTVFRSHSGYSGADVARYRQPGSNGLTLDAQGRLTVNEHGNRRVIRIESNGVVTVLAREHDGRRLNSPNDLVYRSDGSLYFTDPPFGLPQAFDDPAKEMKGSGVFRFADGRLQLLATDLEGPNGLAFSPDEKFLYVSNWDLKRKIVMRYPVQADGSLGRGDVFFDMTAAPGEEALDGLKVDVKGNLYVSGPGGLWILSCRGEHLGTLRTPEQPANFAFGDADGRTLYLAARTGLYRIRTLNEGIRPGVSSSTFRTGAPAFAKASARLAEAPLARRRPPPAPAAPR
ncbi:MAG: SMP-30/gluconolactonase/LRE family protein, partial [Vicinamibacterales bacterium]